eukprot:bmy_08126T0
MTNSHIKSHLYYDMWPTGPSEQDCKLQEIIRMAPPPQHPALLSGFPITSSSPPAPGVGAALHDGSLLSATQDGYCSARTSLQLSKIAFLHLGTKYVICRLLEKARIYEKIKLYEMIFLGIQWTRAGSIIVNGVSNGHVLGHV